MAKCAHCGNDYDKTFEIKRDGPFVVGADRQAVALETVDHLQAEAPMLA
jgi:hypothetical protein